MVKITALLVLKCSPEGSDPVILANASDLSSFGFFQRPSVREFIVFVGRTVSKRTPPGQRQSVKHEEYMVHSYNRNGLVALGFTDDHYPVRSAFSLLDQVLDEYLKNFSESWKTMQSDSTQPWPYLNEAITKFQDPAEADKLLRIQRELDETKIILLQRIGALLIYCWGIFLRHSPFRYMIILDIVDAEKFWINDHVDYRIMPMPFIVLVYSSK
ncbi:VAMP-like protein YKT61 isoform X1 [Primulina tabacum]|uniref:VAMP-like protein YKT61 isoform X1 n=1 Tax=Primulina tabacum TaxID=48773 RepID=UPI003F599C6D